MQFETVAGTMQDGGDEVDPSEEVGFAIAEVFVPESISISRDEVHSQTNPNPK